MGKPSAKDIQESIHKSFKENIEPVFKEIDKHIYKIGNVTIVDFREYKRRKSKDE
jgi:NADPH-dependent 7-cyano-7-deazaguanine reductase QueF